MSVRIRLRRVGRKKQPYFRVVVVKRDAPRDGAYIEELGFYNPRTRPAFLTMDLEKLDEWVQNGAEVSDSVKSLVRKARKGGDDDVVFTKPGEEAPRLKTAKKPERRPKSGPVTEAEDTEGTAEAGAEVKAAVEATAAAEAAEPTAAQAEAETESEAVEASATETAEPAEDAEAEESPEAEAGEEAAAEAEEEVKAEAGTAAAAEEEAPAEAGGETSEEAAAESKAEAEAEDDEEKADEDEDEEKA